MCFELKSSAKKLPKPKVAAKDITVYKIIKKNGNGRYRRLRINGKIEPYEKGFHYYETTPFKGSYCYHIWRNGALRIRFWTFGPNCFHSCKSAEIAKYYHCGYDCMVQEFIIPKGALYYENTIEYISSEIIYPHD